MAMAQEMGGLAGKVAIVTGGGQNLVVDAGSTVTRGAFDQLHEMKADRERAIADA